MKFIPDIIEIIVEGCEKAFNRTEEEILVAVAKYENKETAIGIFERTVFNVCETLEKDIMKKRNTE